MFNIEKYISSSAIVECNRNRKFDPAEIAILICMSHKCSITEKINDLKWLLKEYNKNEFYFGKNIRCGYLNDSSQNKNIYEDIISIIHGWGKMLSMSYKLHTATFRGHQGRVLRPDRAILSGQS